MNGSTAKSVGSPSLASLIATTAQAVAFTVGSAFYPNCGSNLITPVSAETPLDEVVLDGEAPDSAAGAIAGDQTISLGELRSAEILVGSTSLRLADGRQVEILVEHRASFLPEPDPMKDIEGLAEAIVQARDLCGNEREAGRGWCAENSVPFTPELFSLALERANLNWKSHQQAAGATMLRSDERIAAGKAIGDAV